MSPVAGTHFAIKAPILVTAGQAFTFTVAALDPFNNTAPTYTGTVAFTLGATDAGASIS